MNTSNGLAQLCAMPPDDDELIYMAAKYVKIMNRGKAALDRIRDAEPEQAEEAYESMIGFWAGFFLDLTEDQFSTAFHHTLTAYEQDRGVRLQ